MSAPAVAALGVADEVHDAAGLDDADAPAGSGAGTPVAAALRSLTPDRTGDLAPDGRAVRTASGVTFHVHEQGDGDALPTVFLHGGGPGCTGWSDFGPVLPAFAADRRAVLVDLLQYGRSDKPQITGPVWDFHTVHLISLLDELGIERADLVCNSWGGTAAIRLAHLHPGRVGRLVITGSMPLFHGPLAPLPERAARGRNARDVYYGGEGPSWDKMRQLISRLEWYDEAKIPDELVTMRHAQSLDAGERALGESGVGRGDLQELGHELTNLRPHVLFAWGMHDAFLTPDYPLMLARMAPHGHLYVMDRASHHLQEERPAEYAAVVRAFLEAGALDSERPGSGELDATGPGTAAEGSSA